MRAKASKHSTMQTSSSKPLNRLHTTSDSGCAAVSFDIKPQNILWSRHGNTIQTCIADLGGLLCVWPTVCVWLTVCVPRLTVCVLRLTVCVLCSLCVCGSLCGGLLCGGSLCGSGLALPSVEDHSSRNMTRVASHDTMLGAVGTPGYIDPYVPNPSHSADIRILC